MAAMVAQPSAGAAQEADLSALLKEAVASSQQGARALLHGREVRETSLAALLDEASRRNLDILIAGKDEAAAQAALEQAKAAFDPTLSASWSYLRTDTDGRMEVITRPRGAEPEDQLVQDTDFVVGCVIEDGEVVNAQDPRCNSAVVTSAQAEWASAESRPAPFSWTGFLGLSKKFSWGGLVGIGLSSKLSHKSFYAVDGLFSPISARDPFGLGSRFPWTSSAFVSLSTPLPYTKGFGYEGALENLGIALADSGTRRAVWARKAARNAALEQVAAAFWGLVLAGEQVEILGGHLATLNDRLERGERRFEQGLITNYDVSQLRAAVENLKNQREVVWNNYLVQSNSLLRLLSSDDRAVLLPVGFEGLLDTAREIAGPAGDSHARALETNPFIKVSMESLAASRTTVRYRENQTLPDVDLDLSYGVSQTDVTMGYDSIEESLAGLATPDKSDISIALRLTVPFYQRDDYAKLSRARAQERQAGDAATLTRNQVTMQVDAALREMSTARSQIRLTAQELELARFAYEKSLARRERELVTEFEVLRNYDDLLDAQLAHVAAQVRARTAQASLLAAEGVLDERYASLTEGEARP